MKVVVVVPFAKFRLGELRITPGAEAVLEQTGTSLCDFLIRHATGNWGDLCLEDRQVNEAALRQGDRLLSSYRLTDGQSLWIITEDDRSVTTALLPDEY